MESLPKLADGREQLRSEMFVFPISIVAMWLWNTATKELLLRHARASMAFMRIEDMRIRVGKRCAMRAA